MTAIPAEPQEAASGHVEVVTKTVREIPPLAKPEDVNLPPTTTAAQDLTSEGQRQINRVWEFVQAFIAVSVIATVLYVAARLALVGLATAATENQSALGSNAFMFLSSIAFAIIGFYFGRTNHQRVGGIGSIPDGQTR